MIKLDNMNLDLLLETFSKHAQQADIETEENIRVFKEYHPDEPLPSYLADPFNLCHALVVICKELIDLKSKQG